MKKYEIFFLKKLKNEMKFEASRKIIVSGMCYTVNNNLSEDNEEIRSFFNFLFIFF